MTIVIEKLEESTIAQFWGLLLFWKTANAAIGSKMTGVDKNVPTLVGYVQTQPERGRFVVLTLLPSPYNDLQFT